MSTLDRTLVMVARDSPDLHALAERVPSRAAPACDLTDAVGCEARGGFQMHLRATLANTKNGRLFNTQHPTLWALHRG